MGLLAIFVKKRDDKDQMVEKIIKQLKDDPDPGVQWTIKDILLVLVKRGRALETVKMMIEKFKKHPGFSYMANLLEEAIKKQERKKKHAKK